MKGSKCLTYTSSPVMTLANVFGIFHMVKKEPDIWAKIFVGNKLGSATLGPCSRV